MAALVVCLDGTDQIKTQPHPTNVARIYDGLGGQSQAAGEGSFETRGGVAAGKYLPGVGSQGVLMLRILGTLFGEGIAELIVRGYTYLSRNWKPGDDIYLVGFSRGATAARALAGLIAARGLLDPGRYDPNDKNDAYARAVAAWYVHRKAHPTLANQARLAVMAAMLGRPMPKLAAADFRDVPGIAAVAVFDTVSSLGRPELEAGGVQFDFSIIDTTLSPKVAHGFHALSADETRDVFTPTFWAAAGNVTEAIFPGGHSNVGGGFPSRGLSDGALDWMLAQLAAAGLAVDRARIQPAIQPNPLDLFQDDAKRPPFLGLLSRGRAFPHSATPHASLLARWGKDNWVAPGPTPPRPYASAGRYADGQPLHA